MRFNHGLLRCEIKDKFGTLGLFADKLGISPQQMSRLMTGKASWTDTMIWDSLELLFPGEAKEQMITKYFFMPMDKK